MKERLCDAPNHVCISIGFARSRFDLFPVLFSFLFLFFSHLGICNKLQNACNPGRIESTCMDTFVNQKTD